eukprot:753376-Hanusia_phi.AAC.1
MKFDSPKCTGGLDVKCPTQRLTGLPDIGPHLRPRILTTFLYSSFLAPYPLVCSSPYLLDSSFPPFVLPLLAVRPPPRSTSLTSRPGGSLSLTAPTGSTRLSASSSPPPGMPTASTSPLLPPTAPTTRWWTGWLVPTFLLGRANGLIPTPGVTAASTCDARKPEPR